MRTFFLIVFISASWMLTAQSLITQKHYSTNDGLSQNSVQGFVQGDNGHIWMCNWNGLERFDGYTFRNFKTFPSDEVRMTNHRIQSIKKSALNNIWCVTHTEQLYLFDTHTEKFDDVFLYHKNIQVGSIKSVFVLDNGIAWVVGTQGELYRIDEANYKEPGAIIRYDKNSSEFLGDKVYQIYLDKDGDEWILTDNGMMIVGQKTISVYTPFTYIRETAEGVFLANEKGFLVKYQPDGGVVSCASKQEIGRVTQMHRTKDNKLLLVNEYGFSTYNPADDELKVYLTENKNRKISPTFYFEDSKGIVWLLSKQNTIVRFDAEDDRLNYFEYASPIQKTTVSQREFIHEDEYNSVWIKPKNGDLYFYNPSTRTIENAYIIDNNRKIQCTFNMYCFFFDSHKNLWYSTGTGLDYLSFSEKNFDYLSFENDTEVRALMEDHSGRLWAGEKPAMSVESAKICIYDEDNNWLGNLSKSGKIVRDKHASFGSYIYSIYEDKQRNIWIGTKENGLFLLTPQNEYSYHIRQFLPDSANPNSISSNSIYSIQQDSKNRIWVGSFGGGINLVDLTSSGSEVRFIHVGNILNNYPIRTCRKVRCMHETKNGVMLVGTTRGLISFSLDFQHPEAIVFYQNSSDARHESLSNSDVLNISQAQSGQVFVTTMSGGVNVADESQLLSNAISFIHIDKTTGLSHDFAISSLEDHNKDMWVVSENSLTRFQLEPKSFEEYTCHSLKTIFKMSEATPLVRKSGTLVFGTDHGAICIDPNKMRKSLFVPPVIFSELEIYMNGEYHKQYLRSGQQKLNLAAKERNIMVSFVALDYTGAKEIEYAYRMQGLSNEWLYIGNNRSAGFANLQAGDYELQVKSTNGDGVWMDNTTSIHITVEPEFRETIWAKILYLLLILGIIGVVIYILLYIANLRNEMNFEQKLTNLKLRFFTDISHELRTPLTLIINPIEEVIEHEKLSSEGLGNMQVAKQNANRMLQLITQILDFRKIQNNKMKIYLEQIDVIPIIRQVFQSFKTTAFQRNIKYNLVCRDSEITMFVDVDKLEKIVTNLLSNAFKYTANNKTIVLLVSLQDESLKVEVKDEGKGFNVNTSNWLFSRFETNSAKNLNLSTGIGLSLVKELIQLLHGSIHVESAPGNGSTFSVLLPCRYEVYSSDNNVELIQRNAPDNIEDGETTRTTPADVEKQERGDKDTILIVEDNDELRRFVMHILSRDYYVLEASDGRQGLEVTLREIPDIIVSDIMMPEMDGIEFLKKVKENNDVCHIPIVLLSAKSSVEDRIQGLDCGAVDFISKPFNSSYLKVKIQSILKQREMFHAFYMANSSGKEKPKSNVSDEPKIDLLEITHFDNEFMQKVVTSIEENIQNSEYKIDDLADAMNMSRTVFYRKIKSIVGISPVDFVKNMRIKHALKLLETGDYSISEIGYLCGFTTPQYFSKVFKDIMNFTPKEYRRKEKD